MTSARPTVTSAAATAMIISAKTAPALVSGGQEGVEGDEAQVHGVEHQLDADEHENRVAAHHEPEGADANSIAETIR